MSGRLKSRITRRVLGRGVKDFLKKADNFLQRTKLLSNVGSALNSTVMPMQYRGIADKALDYARSKGYGKRKIVYKRGGALTSAGGSLRPAGSGGARRSLPKPSRALFNPRMINPPTLGPRLKAYF